jgi:hypothetical protein
MFPLFRQNVIEYFKSSPPSSSVTANSDVLILNLTDVLCDVTSIDCTYSSNHTLRHVRIANKCPWDNDDVSLYLEMNANGGKAVVARQKILIFHFTGRAADIHAFTRMPETVKPHAISWIGRDSLGYSLMFDFVRGNPTLFDIFSNRFHLHAGVKRKLC